MNKPKLRPMRGCSSAYAPTELTLERISDLLNSDFPIVLVPTTAIDK